jgi:hypothetical protein
VEATVPRETYGRQWLVLLAIISIFTFLYVYATRLPSHTVPTPSSDATQARWFLLLRMPAITSQYESGIDTMQQRYGDWLQTLSDAGFRPILLSEALAKLNKGETIPANSVVLVFDPGFRRTFDLVSPILTRHGWSAVWMTPTQEMDRGHREYVTYHKARQMLGSGNWDVGYIRADGSVSLRDRNKNDILLGKGGSPWAVTAGGLALNQGITTLQRLNVISDWTPADLLNRVRVEVPIDEPRYLTLGAVQNLEWGVTSTEPASMTLAAPLHRRGTQIAWFGARHRPDYALELSLERLTGNLALRLRWNDLRETGLIVRVTNKNIVIMNKEPHQTITLASLPHRGITAAHPLALHLHLQGSTLELTVKDQKPFSLTLPESAPKESGLFQAYLYDAIKGSARAENLTLRLTPL